MGLPDVVVMVILPNGWPEKLFGFHDKHTRPPVPKTESCRSLTHCEKRGSMGVALVVELARARARAERIAVKNFMVRWGFKLVNE